MLLLLAIGAFLALGAVWLWRFRRGQPVDIDEAGYLSIAIVDYRGLVDGGLTGYWEAVMAPGIQAPLMTVLTTPVFVLAGTGILPGLLVPLLLGGVMLLAGYGLGHEVGGPRVAWLTLALIAGAPVVIGYSRSYNFAIASGAATAVMLWAIARSRTFDRVGWSVAAGAAVGLVALSRTLTLAFLPAVVLVGLVALAAGPRRGRRLVGLAVGALAALVVAGPWYQRNGEAVLDYLTAYGYGRGRIEAGQEQSVLSLESWRQTVDYVLAYAALPMVVLWIVGLAVPVGALVVLWRRQGLRTALVRAARSPLMPSLVWAVFCMTALNSTGNKGTGFITPLVPALAVLTAWAIWRLPRPAARSLSVVALTVVALNTVVSLDPRPDWAQQHRVAVPWVHSAPLYLGRGVIQNYMLQGAPSAQNGQLTHLEGREWHRSMGRLTKDLGELGPGPAFTAFGFRHMLVNPNTVQLEQLRGGGPVLSLTMVDSQRVPNDEQAMTDYLTVGEAGAACLLLTARGLTFEIPPIVDALMVERTARLAGFIRTTTVDLPDGRTVVVWRRPATCPAVTDTAHDA